MKNTSNVTRKSIAASLRCNSAIIPVEYEEKATGLAAIFKRRFSLSGLYAMDYDIIYNRVCNLIKDQLATNSAFCVSSFSKYINADTLFYSSEDIQILLKNYKLNPEDTFPYVICFFARKLNSFKRHKIAYIKHLDNEDVDEVLIVGVFKVLERYSPEYPFSFAYLDIELFAAITQLSGEMHTFGMARNDYTNYMKFSYFIDKYALSTDNLEVFLSEINMPEDKRSNKTHFCIDEKDYRYGCDITLKKAFDYYSLYSIENMGIVSATYYDEERELVIDCTTPTYDSGYSTVELELFATQTFSTENEQRIFHHLTEVNGSTFTNAQIKDEYSYTRYALMKLKEKIKKEFF